MLQKKPNQKETDAMIVQEAKQMCSSNVTFFYHNHFI